MNNDMGTVDLLVIGDLASSSNITVDGLIVKSLPFTFAGIADAFDAIPYARTFVIIPSLDIFESVPTASDLKKTYTAKDCDPLLRLLNLCAEGSEHDSPKEVDVCLFALAIYQKELFLQLFSAIFLHRLIQRFSKVVEGEGCVYLLIPQNYDDWNESAKAMMQSCLSGIEIERKTKLGRIYNGVSKWMLDEEEATFAFRLIANEFSTSESKHLLVGNVTSLFSKEILPSCAWVESSMNTVRCAVDAIGEVARCSGIDDSNLLARWSCEAKLLLEDKRKKGKHDPFAYCLIKQPEARLQKTFRKKSEAMAEVSKYTIPRTGVMLNGYCYAGADNREGDTTVLTFAIIDKKGWFVVAPDVCLTNLLTKLKSGDDINARSNTSDAHFSNELTAGWHRNKLSLIQLLSADGPAKFTYGYNEYTVSRGKAWRIVKKLIINNAFDGHGIEIDSRPGDHFKRESRKFFKDIMSNDGGSRGKKWHIRTT